MTKNNLNSLPLPTLTTIVNHNLRFMQGLSWGLIIAFLTLGVWSLGHAMFHWSSPPLAVVITTAVVSGVWLIVTIGRYLINHLVAQVTMSVSDYMAALIKAQQAASADVNVQTYREPRA